MNDTLNNIALIGVGLMGHGIAKNLLLQDYPVRLFAHAGNSDCTDLMALGAESCESYSALCADTHIIMLCVTGSPEVESIVRDLIPHLQQGDTIIDCSTGLPQASVPLAAELAEKGVHYHACCKFPPQVVLAGLRGQPVP